MSHQAQVVRMPGVGFFCIRLQQLRFKTNSAISNVFNTYFFGYEQFKPASTQAFEHFWKCTTVVRTLEPQIA